MANKEKREIALSSIDQFLTDEEEEAAETPAEPAESPVEAVTASPAQSVEDAGNVEDTGVPEGLEELADLKGAKIPRKNAKQTGEVVKTVTRETHIEYGSDGLEGVSYNRQGPGGSRRKAEASEKRAATKEANKEWKSARAALKEAGAPRAISRTVYVDGETKSKHFQMNMQPSLFEALREAADEDGVSINEYVNQAVREKILNS